MSHTLLSELLAPDPPFCPEAIYHRLLSCELRQQSSLVFLEQLKLQTDTPILLHLCFHGMQSALAEGQTNSDNDRWPSVTADRWKDSWTHSEFMMS